MRVISGKARGRKLKRVPGDTTRPVMDRVKENFFNILGDWVIGTRWLDLFAGTGQVGIEALSRDAAEVVFTDNSRAAVRTIQENLAATRLGDGAAVLLADASAYLRRVRQGGTAPFDLIYIAPPQYKAIWQNIMALLDEAPAAFLQPDGLIVVQIDPKEYQELPLERLQLTDRRRYGRTMLCFYEINPPADSGESAAEG